MEHRMKTNEDSLRDLWDTLECTNIHIIEVPKEKRERAWKKIPKDIVAENFPSVGKDTATQVQEAQRAPYTINPKKEHAETHNNQLDKNQRQH